MKHAKTLCLEITTRCNMSCKHCFNNSTAFGKDMDILFFKKTINLGLENNFFIFALTGGEPLLHPHISQMIEYVNKRDGFLEIVTNGLLIPEAINSLATHKETVMVKISLDGIGASHDIFRGTQGLYDKVIKNINLCVSKGIKTHIGITPSSLNYNQIPALYKIASDIGVDTIIAYRHFQEGKGKNNPYSPTIQQYAHFIADCINQSINHRLKIYLEDPIASLYSPRPLSYGCMACKHVLAVDVHGFLHPCHPNAYILGQAKKLLNKLEDEDTYNKIVNREVKDHCANCKDKYLCGGCRVTAFLATGDILAGDPMCKEFREALEKKLLEGYKQ